MPHPTTSEPIRVAQVIGKLKAGGVENVIYNYYRQIDHSKYQFDFIIDSDSEWPFPQELLDQGARIYEVPPYQKLPRYMSALVRLFRENQYRIVHANVNSLSVFSLCAAWIAGVPVRICHNHSTSAPGETKKNLLKYLLRPFAKIFPTHLCACSKLAGEWLFGTRAMEQGKVTIFNNAIETKKFAFDPVMRSVCRTELGIPEDAFVIGHVGRFCFQKNQEFLLDIFAEVHRQVPQALLLLVGIGGTMQSIREKVNRLDLEDAVIFAGARSDVNRLYQAMDVFVLPSRYEGLPVVGVEAQCSGLPVLASDAITREAKASDRIRFLPLDSSQRWAEGIFEIRNQRSEKRNDSALYGAHGDIQPAAAQPAQRDCPQRCVTNLEDSSAQSTDIQNFNNRKTVSFDPKFDIRSEAQKLQSYYDMAMKEIN